MSINAPDLDLPAFGPYTKSTIGLSHIANAEEGIRFDLSVFPGLYRRVVNVPNVMWESGYHVWNASPNFEYFSHRHDIEWKDKFYCDVEFAEYDKDIRICCAEFVNNTDTPQNAVLHIMSSIHFPRVGGQLSSELVKAVPVFEGNGTFVDALSYDSLDFATPRPQDNLVYDGLKKGEQRHMNFVNGSGLGSRFGAERGDKVSYTVTLAHKAEKLIIRYASTNQTDTAFLATLTIDGVPYRISLEQINSICTYEKSISLNEGEHSFEIICDGGSAIIFDGFAFAETSVNFIENANEHKPQMFQGKDYITLKYDAVEDVYGIKWDFPLTEVREFLHDELDSIMKFSVHLHTTKVFRGNGNGHFTNIFMRPVTIEPMSTKKFYTVLAIDKTNPADKLNSVDFSTLDAHMAIAREKCINPVCLAKSEPYKLSQRIMNATLLTNVVYPVYTLGRYIRHNTPGRWWDCLYTWDSGFVGLGLSQLDTKRAVDCLETYLTNTDDEQHAFLHHGSMVPVQFYLYMEIWNKTQDCDFLSANYPKLKRYYEFFVGRLGSSTTNSLTSSLLKTWDYFYNSGGWDDYPPQVHVHKTNSEKTVAPVVSTSHAVRLAKFMHMVAEFLGNVDDIDVYENDAAYFTDCLLKYSWDEESGYFGYVCHDDDLKPIGILKYNNEVNYNMGLDGVCPLICDLKDDTLNTRLLSHLKSPDEMWTDCGLSTVSLSAPYYKPDGYWNGAVWLPHQWFFFKAALDMGDEAFALRIADTALNLWKREVDLSYNSFEHFIIQSGRGAGWHHFGGLSSPAVIWFYSYYVVGTVTTGFNVFITEKSFAEDFSSLVLKFRYYGQFEKKFSIIVVMPEGFEAAVKLNGANASYERCPSGALQISMETDCTENILEINN